MSVPPIGCDCWRLTRALENEELPDHICWETLRASVWAWVREAWDEAAALVDAAISRQIVVEQEEMLEARDAEAALVSLDLLHQAREHGLSAHFDAWELLADPRVEDWPLTVGRRSLAGDQPLGVGLVIREWVHEDPNKALAKLLAGTLEWQIEVEFERYRFDEWRADHPDAPISEWIARGSEPDEMSYDRRAGFRHPDQPHLGPRPLLEQLRFADLPPTPATARHLRAVAAGRREPLPARGLLVTTRAFVRWHRGEGGKAQRRPLFIPGPDVSITGATSGLPAGVFERATNVAIKHRAWAEQLGPLPLINEQARRRAQAAYFPAGARVTSEEELEYLGEALRGADAVVAKALAREANAAEAIRTYLDGVYYRVQKRRIRSELEPTPPPGWRQAAREVLLARIRASRR